MWWNERLIQGQLSVGEATPRQACEPMTNTSRGTKNCPPLWFLPPKLGDGNGSRSVNHAKIVLLYRESALKVDFLSQSGQNRRNRGTMSNGVVANGSSERTHTASQRYMSTRGEDADVRTPHTGAKEADRRVQADRCSSPLKTWS